MRVCSGIFPMSTKTTSSTDEEILKNLLTSVNVTEAKLVCLLPDVSPILVSINNGAFMSIDFLETSEVSAAIGSLRIKTSGTKYQLQVEY